MHDTHTNPMRDMEEDWQYKVTATGAISVLSVVGRMQEEPQQIE
jgi:hypothetical protein